MGTDQPPHVEPYDTPTIDPDDLYDEEPVPGILAWIMRWWNGR